LTINGTLTHTGYQITDTTKINITATNITINTGGTINASMQGYRLAFGPGNSTTGGSISSAGAGYGGEGGDSNSAGRIGGKSYGNITHPTNIGSGAGATTFDQYGSAGGGAIILNITDTLTANGPITANGQPGKDKTTETGGGSGGTIHITTNTLTGTGTIAANGGIGITSASYQSGAGGGGRIAIHYTTDTSTRTITAYGGENSYWSGGAGTVYLKPSTLDGELIIDNNNTWYGLHNENAGTTPINTSITIRNLTVRNYGHLTMGELASINATNVNWSQKGMLTDSGGNLSDWFDGSYNLTVPQTAIFYANTPRTYYSLYVNGTMSHNGYQTQDVIRVNITAVNITVTGKINVSYQGYIGEYGCGQGQGSASAGYDSGGGGHGGKGAAGEEGSGGSACGSITTPIILGSSGGKTGSDSDGTPGGGAILLNATDTITLNGWLGADGQNGVDTTWDPGGGAGGSIFIQTKNLAGSGNLTAVGGTAGSKGGAGGGGRIALYYQTDTSSLAINVSRGVNAARSGNDGTVFRCSYTSDFSCVGVLNNSVQLINGSIVHNTTYTVTSNNQINHSVSSSFATNSLIWTDSSANSTCKAQFNITGLTASKEYYVFDNAVYWPDNPISTDASGIINWTFNLSSSHIIRLENYSSIPSNTPTPTINSTDGTNMTSQDLNCIDTLIDEDNSTMNVSVIWYRNGTSFLQVDYNNSYVNNTNFTATLGSANTTTGNNWSCAMRIDDSVSYTPWGFSLNLTITGNAPTDPTPSINSTDGTNTSDQDLNCFDQIFDPDNDTLNVTVRWYRNGTLNLTVDYNNSYENGTVVIATLNSSNTTVGDNWSCEMRLFDSASYSSWVMTSNLSIGDFKAPIYSDNSTSGTVAGDSIILHLNWSDNVGLSGYIFSMKTTDLEDDFTDNSLDTKKWTESSASQSFVTENN